MTEKRSYGELERRIVEMEELISRPSNWNAPETSMPAGDPSTKIDLYSQRLDLADLVDIHAIQSLMDDFYNLTNIGIAILDLNGKVLVATGWQDICTKFHRVHPKTSKNCLESDLELSNGVEPGTFRLYQCKNGMWDMATPIVVGGQKVGNLYLGQFIFEDESLNVEAFRLQARKYGFDENEYIASLQNVPRWSHKTVNKVMGFYTNFAHLISELGYKNLLLKQNMMEKDNVINSLIESEEKYRILVENAQEAIFIAQDGIVKFANPKTEELTGYTINDLTSQPFTAYIYPSDREFVLDRHKKRMQNVSLPSRYSFRIVHSSGSIRWVELNVAAIQWGDRPATLNFISDITDRKHAEEAIIKERDFISNVLYWIDSLVVVIDMEGYIISFNRASEQLSGYRFVEVRDRPFWDILLAPDEREGVRATIEDVVHKELPKDFQNHWVTKTGEKRLIRWHNSVMRKPDGAIDYILCTGLDITERFGAETALKESEAKYRELVQNANSIITRFDINGNFTFFNEYAEKFFGYTEQEILGKNAVGTIIPETDTLGSDLSSLVSSITKEPERYSTHENENMLRNGHRVWVAWTNKAIYNSKGELTEILCIGNDITERKRLEKQLQQAQKMESIGTLAGGIAHDFNNILSSVIGYTELALDDVEKGSQLESNLEEVFSAGKRARDLVKQILTFARRVDEEIKPVSVRKVAEEALKLLRASIPVTIEIKKRIESNSLIMGDPTQVHQVVMNLCTNAAQAMEDRGGVLEVGLIDVEVDFRTASSLNPGAHVKLWVSDTGVGIAPDIVESIFEPYFTTKAPGEGTGMGLAMVHGIVERYGGRIEVDSKPGKGSVFTIYFPIAGARQGHRPYESEALPSGRERILFVDDEVAITRMGAQILKRLGYSVTTANSGLEALELFRSKPDGFDLVISDMTMPHMTGDELAMQLIALRSDIPCVLCTGYSKKISDEKAANIGIKAFAFKPIVKAELAKIVRKVLDEAKAQNFA